MSTPNFIFILMDDLGWTDLSCYGSSFYETPNLDRLAAEGMTFTDAYASCPVCSPTRASIMSGKYPATVGVTQWIGGNSCGKLCDVPYFWQLPMHEHSLAQALRDGGYQTWHVGKWHLGGRLTWPDRHGFDVNKGGCEWGLPMHGYFSPYGCPSLSDGPEGEYLTDRLTDEAVALIRDRDPDRPFFLNFWHYAVHTPIQAPAELVAKYEQKARDLGLDQRNPIVEGDFFPCLHKKDQRIQRRQFHSHPTYAAMIECMDNSVGRIMAAVAEAGLTQDTMIVFTSDNGGLATAEGSPTCNAPLSEGKGWMYEGGTREPLIIRWPGTIAAGSRCTEPVVSTDFYPTFLQAAGLPLLPEQHVDGVSLMPLFCNDPFERDAIYWHYPHYSNQGGTPGASIRMGDWKLIRFFEDDSLELYNLVNDVSETTNLAAAEPELTQRLNTQLQLWMDRIEAQIPKRNINYQRQFGKYARA